MLYNLKVIIINMKFILKLTLFFKFKLLVLTHMHYSMIYKLEIKDSSTKS